ncbi:hypothetical protein GDO78_011813 [Eleutherodactylus coqui]|uniref:Uncharacterized protein n=1 Tax=Eleutherodactylus coqui TaxID=57060 RepID=A0A8J6F1X7_ELECQ|nr:hypothetical protein GDO78_011813 [Eleutherodactylus coqui]
MAKKINYRFPMYLRKISHCVSGWHYITKVFSPKINCSSVSNGAASKGTYYHQRQTVLQSWTDMFLRVVYNRAADSPCMAMWSLHKIPYFPLYRDMTVIAHKNILSII